MQLSLLTDAVLSTYDQATKPVSNADLYGEVAARLGLSGTSINEAVPVGRTGKKHKLFHRSVRWVQQSLKRSGLIERVGDGDWEVSGTRRARLTAIKASRNVVAVSTDLGMVIWSRRRNVFEDMIDERVDLVFTSPPYPIRKPRAYGGIDAASYTDFICETLEPIVPRLAQGGSIALNISNDIFEPGSPARSTYLERLVIAIEDRLGLKLMERFQWVSNKPPGPVAWASMARMQLNVGYEPVLVFCNDPLNSFADNRRVLQPHTKRHKKFVEEGGVKKFAVNGDGAYRQNPGAYGRETAGAIPRNAPTIGNKCLSGREVKKFAEAHGLPVHGARMPLSLADFFVRWLSRPGGLVVDPFAGTLTTGEAAQINGRRWLCFEMMLEYIKQGFVRFEGRTNAWFNPELAHIGRR